MRLTQKIAVVAAMVSLFLASSVVFADGTSPTPNGNGTPQQGSVHHRHHRHWKQMKQVLQACSQANSITLPAKGSGEHLTQAERSDIRACVQQFRENLKSCVQSAGITRPAPGQKQSAADIASFKQCRTQALSQISAK